VRDAFGLPLQHSYTTFDTAAADAGLTLPDGQGRPLRFASGAGGLDPPGNWPAVVQGGPACLDGKKKCGEAEAVSAPLAPVPPSSHQAPPNPPPPLRQQSRFGLHPRLFRSRNDPKQCHAVSLT